MLWKRIEDAVILILLLVMMVLSVREIILSHDLVVRIVFTVILLFTFWFLPGYVFISASESEEQGLKYPDSKSAQYDRWINQGSQKNK